MPSHVDWGFPKGKIGRPKNNSKRGARLYPAAGQTTVIRPYKSDLARRGVQLFKLEEYDETKGMFLEKFEVYTDDAIGNRLHRIRIYRVRMNDVLRYPKVLEIIEELEESDLGTNLLAGMVPDIERGENVMTDLVGQCLWLTTFFDASVFCASLSCGIES